MLDFETRAFNKHQCLFKYDGEHIEENRVPVTILTKPKNMEQTLPILMMLPDCDLIKLCQLQSWWIPKVYPFIFPGKFRSGARGLPPLLKDCTAHDNSERFLKLLIRVNGRVEIPRNIVIVHEDNSRSFIPEALITPIASLFSTDVLPTALSVNMVDGHPPGSANQSLASDASVLTDNDNDVNDAEEIGVNTNRDTNQDDNNLDDAMVLENPRGPTSQLNHLLEMQTDPRFCPGQDGYGSLHREQRKVTPYRFPWKFTPAEFESHCRMRKSEFFDFVSNCKGAMLKVRKDGLNLHAQSLLFLLKVSHNIPNAVLASMFAVGETTVNDVFIRICLHQYIHCNNIPNILDLNGDLVTSERDKLLETAYNSCPTYFKQLVKDFKDPSGRNRTGVILNVDSTYLDTTSGQDIGK